MVTALTMQKVAPMVERMAAPHTEPPQPMPEPAPAMPRAAYSSPRISFDQNAGVVITQYRDVISGEVKAQFPAESVVASYKRMDSREAKDADKPVAAPGVLEPTAPALGMGGLGGSMPAGAAPIGAMGNGLAAPEQPVGGAAVQRIRTVA